MRARVLFISPYSEDAQCLVRMLQSIPIDLDHAENLRQAHAKLAELPYQAVLTEATLPDGEWLDVLNLARGISDSMAVIVTDRLADAQFWSEVLNLGAFDLMAQPFYEMEVKRILTNACSRVGSRAFAA